MSTGLAAALADRYRIERQLGQGGMASEPATKVALKDSLAPGRALRSRGRSVASRLLSLKRRVGTRHFSDSCRAAALAASSSRGCHE